MPKAMRSPSAAWKTSIPVGVHTGDSIVVAPAQTLTDLEYQKLRYRGPEDRHRTGHRRRLQRPVRPASDQRRICGHRSQSAPVALFSPGLQGNRLPDRQGRDPDRRRLQPGRNPQRSHRHDLCLLRTGCRLHRHQDSEMAFRQIRQRPPHAGYPDEGDRRGHGDCRHLRSVADEGGPFAGNRPAGPEGAADDGS